METRKQDLSCRMNSTAPSMDKAWLAGWPGENERAQIHFHLAGKKGEFAAERQSSIASNSLPVVTQLPYEPESHN